MSWLHNFIPNRPFTSLVAGSVDSKTDLLPRFRFCLAFENIQANVGYISEKLFQAMNAGCVPIYLGDRDIAHQVWPGAFVDARGFKSDRQLLEFARDCPEDKWKRAQAEGRRYLASADAWKFTAEAYAQRVAAVIMHVGESLLQNRGGALAR